MKKFRLVGLALATLLAAAPAAKADSYNFAIVGIGAYPPGPGSSNGSDGTGIAYGSGTLDVTLISGTTYLVNSITGTIDGSTITLFPTIDGVDGVTYNTDKSDPNTYVTPGGAYDFDNILNLGTPDKVDNNGIAFYTGGTSMQGVIYNDGLGYLLSFYNENTGLHTPPTSYGYDINFYVFSPEPSSLMLLGTGLLCMAGFLFWKTKHSTIQTS